MYHENSTEKGMLDRQIGLCFEYIRQYIMCAADLTLEKGDGWGQTHMCKDQNEIARLASVIVGLQADNKLHQDAAYDSKRELVAMKETHESALASFQSKLQSELDQTKKHLEGWWSASSWRPETDSRERWL